MKMKASRRRLRKYDPLASTQAVRQVCQLLRERLPFPAPKSEADFLRFLYSVAHVESHPASDTKQGRPSRWPRKQLLDAASILRTILDRETQGRVSVKGFVSQYLQLLRFPADILEALRASHINLQEAIYLNRVSPARLGCNSKEAANLRREMIEAHLSVQGSQTRLRAKVKEMLGEVNEPEITSQSMAEALVVVDELLEVDAGDSRHLFWEQMKDVYFAMRDVTPEDLDDEILEEFTAAMDEISAVLHKIRKRKKDRQMQKDKDAAKFII